MEKDFNDEILFYKTNLVKCLPLKNNKIRYPLKHEMEKCFPNLIDELNFIKPSIVFLLGKQVAQFVISKFSNCDISLDNHFNYLSYRVDSTIYVPIHHPSYILVYKRKLISNYIQGIRILLEKYYVVN